MLAGTQLQKYGTDAEALCGNGLRTRGACNGAVPPIGFYQHVIACPSVSGTVCARPANPGEILWGFNERPLLNLLCCWVEFEPPRVVLFASAPLLSRFLSLCF